MSGGTLAPGYTDADQSMADPALFTRLFPQHRARWAGYVGAPHRP